jgi:hypothetical protein
MAPTLPGSTPSVREGGGERRSRLETRRDVFLGYCGASSQTADIIRTFLEVEMGAMVRDWKRDFRPGRTILQEIEEARDNVMFKAGYFASAKSLLRPQYGNPSGLALLTSAFERNALPPQRLASSKNYRPTHPEILIALR